MKKTLILLFCFPLLSYAQHSDRVLLIKKMYKETRSYEKEGDCKTISWLSIGDPMDDGLGREVIKCLYPEGYSKIAFSFDITYCAGAPSVSAEYYYKNDNLYFAYIVNEVGIEEDREEDKTRLYFTSDGEIEKLLVDYGEGNVEIKDINEIERIKQPELEWLEKAKEALIHGKAKYF